MRDATSSTVPVRRPVGRRRLDGLLLGVASIAGLWIGFRAPSTSPVTPVAPSPVAVATRTAPVDTGASDRAERPGHDGRSERGRR